ncbi:tellurite resistance TerB C-terminal domain-containing protein [Mucilaginibacter sp.]
MIAFGIILFFVLLIGYLHSPKGEPSKKTKIQVGTSHSVTSAMPLQHQPKMQPDSVTLSLVAKHFGKTWQQYLINQSAQLPLSNRYIYNLVALTYERLQHEEFLALIKAFRSPTDGTDDYSLLHEGILGLAQGRRFMESEVINLIRELPKRYYHKHILEAVTMPMIDSSESISIEQATVSIKPEPKIEASSISNMSLIKNAENDTVDSVHSDPVIATTKVSELVDTAKPLDQIEQGVVAAQPPITENGVLPLAKAPEPDVIDIDTTVKPIIYTETKVVPIWPHRYVYSADELREANPAQKAFYEEYKAEFYNGRHLDLQGNTNYGFILFFELLDDYRRHQNLQLLERRLHDLEISCPRTCSYAKSNLVQLMRAAGNHDDATRIENAQANPWHWRERYIRELNLSKVDAQLLNSIWISGNAFVNIEFCAKELIKLYVSAMKVLAKSFQEQQTSKRTAFEFIGDLIARKQNHYRTGSPNYKYTVEHSESTLSEYILRYCESELRVHLGHNRKMNINGYLDHSEVILAIREKIIAPIATRMPELLQDVAKPNEAVEVALNAITPTRWKNRLFLTAEHYAQIGLEKFKEEVDHQLRLNVQNSSLDIIFQDVVKFLAQHDKSSSLQYYLRYSHYCFGIKNADPKSMPKNLQKVLFKTEMDIQRFDELVTKVKTGGKLAHLLAEAAIFYAPVRKKITLNTTLINQVEHQYTGTVELLNEYLQDEEPVSGPVVSIHTIGPINSTTNYALTLTTGQSGLIELFKAHDFALEAAAIDTYCQDVGLMRSALVNDINEHCYELLDDPLIEEQDQQYTINPYYYQQLLVS